MKVALIYYSDMDFGGAERRFTRIYNQIGKTTSCDLIVRGCTKEVLISRIKNSDCGYNNLNKIICFTSDLQCLKHIIQEKYDVIHCFDTSRFNATLVILSSFIRCKTIVSIASVPIAERFQNRIASFIDKTIVRNATVVDVLYPWGHEYITKYRSKKITRTTVGTFTDLDVFKPAIKTKILVYAAARLESIKNPDLLIDACALSQNTIRDYGYKILLLGKGELENKLRKSIEDYGIQDIVEMPGYKKTSDYFPNAEAVFSLQKNENYPSQVIAEASACGCYLFVTDVGTSRMCASEEFCTFIEEDSAVLGKAIEDFILFSEEKKSMIAIKAREYACQNYTIENSVEYYKSLF